MLNLFKIERYKMRRFTPFYASMGFLVFLVIYDLIVGIKQSYIDAFPNGRMYDGFKDGISDLSFSFLIGMLIAWYVGIDFTNRTLHRVIVTGNQRWKIVISQLMATSILTTIFHLGLAVETTIKYGRGFGYSFDGFNKKDIVWVGVVILQMIAMNAFYMLITYICGNAYTALFACVSVAFIGGNILRNLLYGNVIYDHSFLCFARSSSNSDLIPCAICAIIAIVVFVTVTIRFFNKRDVSN